VKLGYDLSILRHPYGGTARYAVELLHAMEASTSRGDEIIVDRAWPRTARGHRIRRFVNLAADVGWLAVGIPITVFRRGIDVWYSPSNIISPTLRRPAIVTIHDVNFLVQPDAYDRGYARYAEIMFRRSAQHARHVVTDSDFSRSQIISAFGIEPTRISVLYPGLDHGSRAEMNREAIAAHPPGFAPRYCLFVGQTEPHKNVGLLLDAWQRDVPPDVHLLIVGPPGRDDQRLRVRADHPTLRGRIQFMGQVSDARLERLYQDAACFLLPSRAEGFGFPALEAMARGVPTAVARSGSLPEVTGGAAETFDPDDAGAVAGIVTRLVEDSDARADLISRGRAVAARYKWSTSASQLWRLARAAAGTFGDDAPAAQA
jgi:glycosyltransferase involved in cell wall biosynthesis